MGGTRWFCLVLIALAIGGCGGDAEGPGPAPPAIVQVLAGEGAAADVATGFVVGDGRVLTVAHALTGVRRVRVVVPGRPGARAARVVRSSARLDAAVLAVAGVSMDRRLVPRHARAGDTAQVWVLRDDRPTALRATVRRPITAHVHGLDGTTQTRPALELSAATVKGDSGAPVLDADGRLLGLAFAHAHASDNDAGPAYAVAATALAPLLP